MILLSLAVITAVSVKLGYSFWYEKKEVPHVALWNVGVPIDAGEDAALNLAPRRADSSEELEEKHNFPTANSSRDPMAEFLANTHPSENHHQQGHVEAEEPAPTMYFGPTLDEDGFPLHNIDII